MHYRTLQTIYNNLDKNNKEYKDFIFVLSSLDEYLNVEFYKNNRLFTISEIVQQLNLNQRQRELLLTIFAMSVEKNNV